MTHEMFMQFHEQITTQGIENYAIRCQGGSNIFYHNGKSGIIIPDAEGCYAIECSGNYASGPGAKFTCHRMTWDFVDSVFTTEVPFDKMVGLFDSMPTDVVSTDQMKEYIKQVPHRSGLVQNPNGSNAGLDVVKDEDGNTIVPKGSSGYVTYR